MNSGKWDVNAVTGIRDSSSKTTLPGLDTFVCDQHHSW